ncbi:EpsI family protein [Candidatus Poribacteria bacterium]|nr:EpsI family protein [Candidatus Poribacteria bacterium]
MENFVHNHIQRVRQEGVSSKGFILLASLILVCGFGFIYYPTLQWFWLRWFRNESYYSHGILIPLLSAFLIWRVRRQLREIPIQCDNSGLLMLVGGLLMHLLSAWMRIHFTSGLSIVMVLFGMVWYLLGFKMTKALWFPLFFLVFMVPMPMDLISRTTLHLKLFAASLGSSLTNFLGTPNIQEGSIVYLPTTVVTIDAPCSGLRSLITFLAMGSLYAYLASGGKTLVNLRKWSLVLLCVPIAIFANLIRVVLILIIANRYGIAIITNDFLHKSFGLLVFVIGLISFFVIAKILKLQIPLTDQQSEKKGNKKGIIGKERKQKEMNSQIPSFLSSQSSIQGWLKPLGITGILLAAVGGITFGAYSELMDDGVRYTHSFPQVIGDWRATSDWYAQNPETAREVFDILETEDTIHREYRDLSGNSVGLVIVYSPHNRKVAHPPDICFQGGGWQQQLKDTLPVLYGLDSGLSQINRLVLDKGGAKQIALYWYKSGNRQTSSYLNQQVGYLLNSTLRRKSRSVALIRLTTYADSADQIPSKTQQLKAFAEQVVPLVNRTLP